MSAHKRNYHSHFFYSEHGSFLDNMPDYNGVSCPTLCGMIRDASLEQDQIGWFNAIEGRLSIKWKKAQDIYHKSIPNCTQKSTIWAKKKTMAIYKIPFQMWLHRNNVLYDQQMTSTSAKKREN